jgi:hypothetical protein
MAEEALEAAEARGAPQDAVLRLVAAGVRPPLAAALLAAPAAGADDSGAAATSTTRRCPAHVVLHARCVTAAARSHASWRHSVSV